MPSEYIRSLVISDDVWQKLAGKHGLSVDDLLEAVEGRSWPYKVEPDPRGDKWVLMVPLGTRVALLRIRHPSPTAGTGWSPAGSLDGRHDSAHYGVHGRLA